MNGDVVDTSSLAQLLEDVGPAAAAGMIDRFVDMLPVRVARLRAAVADGEAPELRDASLSLGCSATMLGAHRLAAACARCHTTDRRAARAALTGLEQLAAATCHELVAVRVELSAT